jgi:hypothetical protein
VLIAPLIAAAFAQEPSPVPAVSTEPAPVVSPIAVTSPVEPAAPAAVAAPEGGAPTPPPAPVAEPAAAPALKPFELGALFTVWGLTQNNFLLGREHPLDDAAYTVQMLRLSGKFNKPDYGIVAQADLAQGWWGVDNSPNNATVVTVDGDGNPVGTPTYNADALFANKDTKYAVHVDLAYGWVNVDLGIPWQVRAGRQFFGVGHKLVLDVDLDGVQIEARPSETVRVQAWFAKMSEGAGSFLVPKGLLMSDQEEYADAALVGLVGSIDPGEHHVEAYVLGYQDGAGNDAPMLLPQGLGYAMSRFQPQITRALVTGVSADLDLDVAEGLEIQAEADVLVGEDDRPNTDHAGGLLDVNDGSLFGWNGWLRAEQAVVEPFSAGLAFGIGSGDADKTGGSGNLSRLQTMGFWQLTNVWEDSVMPDVQGISPQGLGSPVSRGYRELENTTAVQAFAEVRPVEALELAASGTWLRATTPIQGFDATGTPTATAASDLGFEVDLDARATLRKGVTMQMQSGVFFPGDAAALLINGNTDTTDLAWEIKLIGALKI